MEIICGKVDEILKSLPDNSIDCCVTSPPYYNLRDYGIEGQIGLEQTPEQYIDDLLVVFREVRRTMKAAGTLWINIADSYAGSSKGKGAKPSGKQATNIGSLNNQNLQINFHSKTVKPKDMIGIPWMLAFALRNDGWFLRSDIIWHKTNAMPNPVRDRPVSCYEHIFLLTKSAKYYFDYEAIKEPASGSTDLLGTRRSRDVWSMSKNNMHNKHYAAYPVKLAERCILAGCRKSGIVLDPFCGSGTTGEAAMRNERDCILIDINAEYCTLTQKRLSEYKQEVSI